MAEVLPSVNCNLGDDQAVEKRIAQIAAMGAPMAHFDVADGVFTFHKSWDAPEKLASLGVPGKFAFEVHLMVEDPRAAAARWLAAGAKRIAVHMEVASPGVFKEIAAAAREKGAETFLSLNPEAAPERARDYADDEAGFLVLSVHPGLSGQGFLPRALDTVRTLRQEFPDATIEIDGGVNPETGRAALAAGANILVSDSDIFGSHDPAAEYHLLAAL